MSNVVLVPGIFDSPVIFRSMSGFLHERGWTPLTPRLSPNDGSDGLEKLAEQLKAFVDERIEPEQRFDLVGYSMGGLVSRYYLQRLGGLRRVRRFITLAAPHNGSYMAYLLPNRGGEQMRPGSAFIEDLNRDVVMLEQVDFVSLWTPWDLSIVPARSSVLPVGRDLQVAVAAHPLMVLSRRSQQEVVRLLGEPFR